MRLLRRFSCDSEIVISATTRTRLRRIATPSVAGCNLGSRIACLEFLITHSAVVIPRSVPGVRSEPPRFDSLGALFPQRGDHAAEHRETFVPSGSSDITSIDLLGDSCDLEQTEHVVEEQVRDVTA